MSSKPLWKYMRLFLACLLIGFATLTVWDFIIRENQEIKTHHLAEKDADAKYHAGLKIYKAHCQNCHGKRGDGQGTFQALDKSQKMSDFTSPRFTRSKKELKLAVSEGRSVNGLNPLMPKWKTTLTEEEINQVVYFIQTMHKEGGIRRRLVAKEMTIDQ